jgi:plastocyanin
MKNPIVLVILVLAVIAVGGYFLTRSSEAPAAPTPSAGGDNPPVAMPVEPPGFETGGAVMAATVHYTQSGFSPSTITVAKGATVTFVNESNRDMWVASAQHPSHTSYSGTSRSEHCPGGSTTAFDQCASGDSYVFTFGKVGTWSYHDHLNPQFQGTVIVAE